MDIRKWSDKYSIDIRLLYNSDNTRKNYISQVNCFLLHFENEIEPKSIPNEKIKLWLLEAKTINTRKHRLCAINSFYKHTVGMPSKIQKIPYPKAEKKLPQVVKQLADKAGIQKRVYTHLMRHCSFTHMCEGGTDINIIKVLAGHNNVKTTMIYTHMSHNIISNVNSPINAIRIN